jgi:hypothetical protein
MGSLSQCLRGRMTKAGLAIEPLETRHVRDAFSAMPVKSDRNDVRGIAQLMRLGWFRPVHCKSLGAQETRAMLGQAPLTVCQVRAGSGETGPTPDRDDFSTVRTSAAAMRQSAPATKKAGR